MKVLFAVSNENISESIVKKYQKDYKEIISSKNVYYFNAIQKELQKDNTYDRIVISEDLEPFTNNNYDAIDRFIFDKLELLSIFFSFVYFFVSSNSTCLFSLSSFLLFVSNFDWML